MSDGRRHGSWMNMSRQVMAMTWPDIPENFGENYNHATAKQIRDNPTKWLNSLPMFEYAFMLVVNAAQAYGGPWEKYYEDMYVNYMMPILDAYHKRLMKYRYHRAIFLRNYDSMRGILTDTSMVEEIRQMKCYARKTRKALRCAVADFIDVQKGNLPGPKPVEETLPEAMQV